MELLPQMMMSLDSAKNSTRMKHTFSRLAVALALGTAALSAVAADAWPSKPIRFVVPFGPGGANDLVARAVAEAASKQLGQPIIVENKLGAGSVLGADLVAKASPDGYTFLAPAGGVITNAMIKAKMPYREEDLVPVAMTATLTTYSLFATSPEAQLQHGERLLYTVPVVIFGMLRYTYQVHRGHGEDVARDMESQGLVQFVDHRQADLARRPGRYAFGSKLCSFHFGECRV